jgi:hypothetical protein
MLMRAWGSDLSGRALGALARADLEVAVRNAGSDGLVNVDFGAVHSIGSSFADECFGVLVRQMREEGLRTRLRFTAANDEIVAVLKFVLAQPAGDTRATAAG